MFQRKGASLITTIATLCLGVGALGAAGYTLMNGGLGCGSCVAGTCDTPAPTASVMTVAAGGDTETAKSGSCCPLGDLAAQGDNQAEIVEASNEEKSACSKPCASTCSGKQGNVVAASNDAGKNCAKPCASSCSDKAAKIMAAASGKTCGSSCGDKSPARMAPTVLQASFPVMMPAMDFAKSSCASKCGSACGDKAAKTMAASTGKTCAASCASSCGDMKPQVVATTVEKTCAASRRSACGSKSKAVAILSWDVMPGVVRPASFIRNASAKSCASSCCSSKTNVQAASAAEDSGCCKGSGERADGKACCGGCTEKKENKGEPVAAAN